MSEIIDYREADEKMLSRDEIVSELKNNLGPKRFEHSLRVEAESVILAKRYDADVEVCRMAGLLHDCARDFLPEEFYAIAQSHPNAIPQDCTSIPILMHSYAGAVVAEEKYKIADERILNAIRLHTLGSADMTSEDKIVCLADYIEPGRSFHGVNLLREYANKDLDFALLKAFDSTIRRLLSTGRRINVRLVRARNSFLK